MVWRGGEWKELWLLGIGHCRLLSYGLTKRFVLFLSFNFTYLVLRACL